MGWAGDNGIRAICFDIDGTFYPKWQTNLYLLRSALRHPVFSMKYNSMRQALRSADGTDGGQAMDLESFRRREMETMGFKGSFEDYMECYQRFMLVPWERNMGFLKPFDHVKESLEKAKEQGYLLAALSDFPLSDKLSILGLDGLFDYEMSTEDCGHLKPSRIPFLVMLSALGVEPSQALYVGDSYRKDIVGASSVGMRSLWIRKGARREGHPLADLVLTTWESFATMVLD